MSDPARASGWIPVRRDKTGVLPVHEDKTKATYQNKRPAKQGKPPAKRLHKQGPEVHKIIQAATSKKQDSPEPSWSGSSSDDSRTPVVGRPGLKHQSDPDKLAALVAARDCEKCQWQKGRKGCQKCLGFFYQIMRLTTHNLPALQAKIQQEQDQANMTSEHDQ